MCAPVGPLGVSGWSQGAPLLCGLWCLGTCVPVVPVCPCKSKQTHCVALCLCSHCAPTLPLCLYAHCACGPTVPPVDTVTTVSNLSRQVLLVPASCLHLARIELATFSV